MRIVRRCCVALLIEDLCLTTSFSNEGMGINLTGKPAFAFCLRVCCIVLPVYHCFSRRGYGDFLRQVSLFNLTLRTIRLPVLRSHVSIENPFSSDWNPAMDAQAQDRAHRYDIVTPQLESFLSKIDYNLILILHSTIRQL